MSQLQPLSSKTRTLPKTNPPTAARKALFATAMSGTSASPVPRLIKFSGLLLDHQGQPLKGPVGVTFGLYAQQSGDSPLWHQGDTVQLMTRMFDDWI